MEDDLKALSKRFNSSLRSGGKGSRKSKFNDEQEQWLSDEGFYIYMKNFHSYKNSMGGRTMKAWSDQVVAPAFLAKFYPNIIWDEIAEQDGAGVGGFLDVRDTHSSAYMR